MAGAKAASSHTGTLAGAENALMQHLNNQEFYGQKPSRNSLTMPGYSVIKICQKDQI